jgi:S1-C subfamily serine protease
MSLVVLALATRASAAETKSPRTIEELVRSVEPWVVGIRVERTKDVDVPRDELPFQGAIRGRGESADYFKRPAGWVTGILVDRAGFVLTSHYNVLGEIKKIHVRLSSGETRSATLIARSRIDDVALLRLAGRKSAVEEKDWRDPPWATSGPRTGDVIFAVGRSPDPKRVTITEGIVSALGRNGDRAVQTDAKLNYGNVGGPLLDLHGKIVAVSGFVGHTYPQWGFNSGIGFGTTAKVVREILPRLKKSKNIERPDVPFLGIQSEVVNPDIHGAPVLLVVDGSSAERAGVKKGDVIIEFNGRALDNFNQLRFLIFAEKVGEKVEFKVRRGEKTVVLKGILGKRPPRT